MASNANTIGNYDTASECPAHTVHTIANLCAVPRLLLHRHNGDIDAMNCYTLLNRPYDITNTQKIDGILSSSL
jgi:hypothetical protein